MRRWVSGSPVASTWMTGSFSRAAFRAFTTIDGARTLVHLVAQPGDLDYELAVEMEAQGCTMTESDMLAFLGERGANLGLRQSIIIDLARLGDLRWDRKDSYTLVGWGQCA